MADMADELKLEEMLRRLEESEPSAWILEMREHFRRTGYYRPEDLHRLLGDPTDRVELRPEGPLVVSSQGITQKR
jgi:hypothetical protein